MKRIIGRLVLGVIISVLCITGAYSATLKNLTNYTILVRLNSGIEIHLPPKGTKTVADKEVAGNGLIQQLVEQKKLLIIRSEPVKKK